MNKGEGYLSGQFTIHNSRFIIAHCGIVPPHMLIAICRNGTAEERDRALATIVLSERLR